MNKQQTSTITPGEWNRVFIKALNAYKAAIWNMAAVVELGSSKFGRDRIVELTPFDEKKVNAFNKLGRLTIRNKTDMLPEIANELVGLTKEEQRKWGNAAKDKEYKPKELRKRIRLQQSVGGIRESNDIRTREKVSKMPQWPKHATLLVTELQRMGAEDRERAKTVLTQLKTLIA